MKILYLITRLDNKGPVNQLYSLVRAAIKHNDVTFVIVTLYEEVFDSRKNEFLDLGVEVHSIGLKKKYDILKAKTLFEKMINDIDPDIIHSATLPADAIAGFSNKKGKVWCTTMHSNIYVDYLTRFGFLTGRVYILFHRFCVRKANEVICCSKSIFPIYKNKKWGNVSFIQNGIDVSVVEDFLKVSVDEMRRRYKLVNLNKVAIIVGSIDERKNVEFVLSCYRNSNNPDKLKLVVLGEGPMLEKLILEYGKEVLFVGQTKEVFNYLRCADIYISASKSEGLPLSVIEAGCMGIELLLSDIDAHREIAEEIQGRYISLYDINNPKELISLLNMIELGNYNFGDDLSALFKDSFSSTKMCDLYLGKYSSLLSHT